MLKFFTLCMQFLAGPFLVIALLGIVEIAHPSTQGSFWVKVGLAMAGFGLGSVLPYFSSDEALYLKFATIKVQRGRTHARDDTVVLTFATDDKDRYDFVKSTISIVFLLGVVIWVGNYFLSERLSYSEAPVVVRQFWLLGVIYCVLTGILFIYLSFGRKTNLIQHSRQVPTDGGGARPISNSPVNASSRERGREEEAGKESTPHELH